MTNEQKEVRITTEVKLYILLFMQKVERRSKQEIEALKKEQDIFQFIKRSQITSSHYRSFYQLLKFNLERTLNNIKKNKIKTTNQAENLEDKLIFQDAVWIEADKNLGLALINIDKTRLEEIKLITSLGGFKFQGNRIDLINQISKQTQSYNRQGVQIGIETHLNM